MENEKTRTDTSRYLKKTIILLLALLMPSLSAINFNEQVEYVHPDRIEIPNGLPNEPTSVKVQFPAIKPLNGYRVCLAFKAYLYMEKAGGWNPYLSMELNCKKITSTTSDGENRLLRRGEYMITSLDGAKRKNWWQENRLVTFFGNGIELDPRVVKPREEGYDYFLDVDDLINKVKVGPDFYVLDAKENVLTLKNHLRNNVSPCKLMRIDDLKIIYIPIEEIDAARTGGIEIKWKPAPIMATLKGTDFTAEITGGGDLLLKTLDGTYSFYSEFSYPAKPEMLFNRLNPEKANGINGWTAQISDVTPYSVKITASSSEYTLEREFKLENDKIIVNDKITNTSQNDIACAIRYGVSLDKRIMGKDISLGGVPGISFINKTAENPTIFISQPKSSLGIFMDDNIMRLQMSIIKLGNCIQAETNNFGLPPGESHLFERLIYPLKTRTYFDFVNYIRNERKINFTQLGVGCASIREPALKGLNVKYTNITPWFEYWTGLKLTREKFKEHAQKTMSELKKFHPGLQALGMLETNILMADRSKIDFKGYFDKMEPNANENYNGCKNFTKEQTQFLLKLDEFKNFADSFHYLADKRLVGCWDKIGDLECLLLFVNPEIGNYRHKNILEQCDFLLDEVGLDGVYMDQFDSGGATNGWPIDCFSFDRWDRRTVKINKSGEIESRIWNSSLAGASSRKEIIEHVLKKDKIFSCNTQPCTKETSRLPVLRYVELENDAIDNFIAGADEPPMTKHGAKCHFSPIAQQFGLRPQRYMKDKNDKAEQDRLMTRGIITALRNGSLYRIYGHPSMLGGCVELINRMYPFTPVELNEGYLIGKERIITCVSRNFNVKSIDEPKCFAVDKWGQPKKDPGFKALKTSDGWTVDVKLVDWNEVAVVELQ